MPSIVAIDIGGTFTDIVVYDPNGHTSIGVDKTHHMNMDHSAWEGFEIDGHVGYYCAGMNKLATVRVHGNAGPGLASAS